MRRDQIEIGGVYAVEYGWRHVARGIALGWEAHKERRYSGAARTVTRVQLAVAENGREITPATPWAASVRDTRDVIEPWAEYEDRQRAKWAEEERRREARMRVHAELAALGWPIGARTRSGDFHLIEVETHSEHVVITINDGEQFVELIAAMHAEGREP